MDWRDRKYYCVSFDYYSRNMRLDILKSVGNIKIHSYKNVPKQSDETKERGNYQYLLGVPKDLCDVVEYELKKQYEMMIGVSGGKLKEICLRGKNYE